MSRLPRDSIIGRLGPEAQRQIAEQFVAEDQRRAENKTKFHNVSVVLDGLRFPSQREANRYLFLKAEERDKLITDLKVQPAWRIEHNGVVICDYVADFSYRRGGRPVVEDAKSKATRTKDYMLKRKLMLAFHRITIIEV